MINKLIYFGIPILCFILLMVSNHKKYRTNMLDTVFYMFLSFIIFIVLGFITFFLTISVEQELYLKEHAVIYAIENTTNMGGRFFLGSGGFSTKREYYYLGDYKNGKKVYQASQADSYVIEDNDQTPNVKIYKSEFRNRWLRKNIPNFFYEKEYKFTIPEDSIEYDYNIDLKNN